jgi:hypothetical protein
MQCVLFNVKVPPEVDFNVGVGLAEIIKILEVTTGDIQLDAL